MLNSLRCRTPVSNITPRHTRLMIVATVGGGLLALSASAQAQTSPDSCPGYTVCPVVNFLEVINNDPDVRVVNNRITAIEQQTLNEILSGSLSEDPKSILGEVMIYDRNLSVNGTTACATCHTSQEGFTGGVSVFNDTTVSLVGAIGNRASGRKPMSYGYAPFAPILSFRASTGDFVGGNFWDDRATGMVTGNPAGDQALGPPLNPLEMANPDAACVVVGAAVHRHVPGRDAAQCREAATQYVHQGLYAQRLLQDARTGRAFLQHA
jgi:hypothetical protein